MTKEERLAVLVASLAVVLAAVLGFCLGALVAAHGL